MADFKELKTDCRHFRYERPCAPHKNWAVTCPDCSHYDAIQTHVLMVKLAAVGDVLRTTALLPAIRQRYPNSKLTWLTDASAKDLFGRNPQVDEVCTTDDPAAMARLAMQTFDVVLCPDADPGTAALAASVTAKARHGFSMDAKGRVTPLNGAAEQWFRMGISDVAKRANQETYQSLVAQALDLDPKAVAEPILIPSAEEQSTAQSMLAANGHTGPWVGLNTGAGKRWRYKRWTLEHQRSFVAQMSQQGVGVLLLGGPGEDPVHAELEKSQSKASVMSAGTHHGFTQFAAFVERCQVLVTGDTLALHVGCARKVPVVVLFGPTSAAEIELYGRGSKLQADGLECLSCYLPDCDVRPHCQALIQPDKVSAAVLELLNSSK